MDPKTPITNGYKDKALAASQWTTSLSLCPQCLQRVRFLPADRMLVWVHCSRRWEASKSVVCPHPQCGRPFAFAGQAKCPHCYVGFEEGIPLAPILPGMCLLDRILPSRTLAVRVRRELAERELRALRESWVCDSNSSPQIPFDDRTQFGVDFREVLSRHEQLLAEFKDDLEKFLYAVPVRLAKHESEYSWKLEEALGKEVSTFLDGILHNRHSVRHSLGFVARCCERTSETYSRKFLSAELKRRFYERRSAPRPGFQLTLEYARTLDGIAFEEWLIRLLRDAGVPGVCRTQDSRDQGADIVITIGSRRIVVQAKQYQDTTGNKSVQEVFGARHYYNASEAWVVTTSTFSKDAIDLAIRTGVHLVDGSRLMNLPELLCRPAQAITDQRELADTAPAVESSESACSPIVVPESEPVQTIPTALSAPEDGTVASIGTTTVLARLQSLVKGWGWRGWLPIGLVLIALAALVIPRAGNLQGVRTEREVQGLLEWYQAAERSRNPQLLAECYAPEVETYYLRHNVPRNVVLLGFQHAFEEYSDVKAFEFSKVTFSEANERQATATLNREWNFAGTKNFAGDEIEQMVFRKVDGRWLIVSEHEVRINWERHWSP